MKGTTIQGYHAHVYYGNQSKEKAQRLREALESELGKSIQLGRWHDRPIGPHPEWSYQREFDGTKLATHKGGEVNFRHDSYYISPRLDPNLL